MGVLRVDGWRRAVGVVALFVAASSCVAVGVVGAAEGDGWAVPVDAVVVDGFRPPANRYAAGNRGIEYATSSGDPVRAVDAGRVVFAGTVGRSNHVTIDHGNGLRSTAAFVEAVLVVRGQPVERGDLIARAGPGFHLTARLGDVYVDPALLFAGAEVVLALVGDPSGTAAGVAAEATRNWGGVGPLGVLGMAIDAVSFHHVVALGSEAGERWKTQDCESSPAGATNSAADSGGETVPTGEQWSGAGRTLIQVGGLGSSSSEASIGDLDVLALGYDPNEVIGFSYAGGCTPVPFGLGSTGAEGSLTAELGSQPYQPAHTYADIDRSAVYLADLIEVAAALRPGQPIDIAAHSLGGVVTRRALEILDSRPGATLPATVVTIGSPHQGVNLADAAVAAAPGSLAASALDRLGPTEEVWDAISVAQVATTGPLALAEPDPPPAGVRVVSIGGATDPIVPLSSTWWEGAVNVVVPAGFGDAPGFHGDLPGLALVEVEFARAVAGRRPVCQSLAALLLGVGRSGVIQQAEDLVALGVGVLSLIE